MKAVEIHKNNSVEIEDRKKSKRHVNEFNERKQFSVEKNSF